MTSTAARTYTVTASRPGTDQTVWTVRGTAPTAAEAMRRAARSYRQSRNAERYVTWTAVADGER